MLIYDKNTPLNLSSFSNNGLGYLTDFKSNPKITEELNSKGIFTGNYKLEFEYAKDGLNAEYLQELNFIKVNHDGKDQIFYIENIKKTLKGIYVFAKHIFFLTKNGFLEDTRVVDDNATSALDELISDTQFDGIFSAYSDVESNNTAYYIRKNLIEAIITADNSILKNWNCDLELDNFTIKLLNQRGQDIGITIEYGKNLTGIEYYVDYSDIATRIMPQGANELLLPEKYVDSPLIENYPIIYYQHIVFDDVEINDEVSEEEALAILRGKVNDLYVNGIDTPKINIKVDWVDVSKTEEYKDYEYFETIKLGDIVNIRFMGMNLTARVIKTVWDCIQKKYTNFELGTVKTNLLQIQKTVAQRQIQEIVNVPSILNKAQQNATNLITNFAGGYRYITQNEIYIMDTDDPNTATKIWRWNLNGLGYSSNGINGPYELAMTMDGKIVADFITTGELDGSLIKAGSIKAEHIATEVLEQGGNNLLINPVGLFGTHGWTGVCKEYTDTEIKNNTFGKSALFMQNGTRSQIVQVPNGIYTISFLYKKLLSLADCKIEVNEHIIDLTEEEWTKEVYTFEVASNTIEIKLISDNDDSCYVSDLMLNAGLIAQKYSSNATEVVTKNVKIGDGIEVSSNASNIKQKMDNDGNRIINTNTDEIVAEFTDKGMNTKELKASKGEIAKTLIVDMGNQTWISRL